MAKRPDSAYAAKRKLRRVPVGFSEPCMAICAALRDPRIDEGELNHYRARHDAYLFREFGNGRLSEEWQQAKARAA